MRMHNTSSLHWTSREITKTLKCKYVATFKFFFSFLSLTSCTSFFFFFTSSSRPHFLLTTTDRAQLYQQYSEAAQNFEILRQSRSDVLSVGEDSSASPAPSPPPARRPLPPLPPVPHPHSLTHTGSVTSVRSLPLPEPPRSEGRPTSPRLSISLTQSNTLWRELPGVRSSNELEDLPEDKRRLQEVKLHIKRIQKHSLEAMVGGKTQQGGPTFAT